MGTQGPGRPPFRLIALIVALMVVPLGAAVARVEAGCLPVPPITAEQ